MSDESGRTCVSVTRQWPDESEPVDEAHHDGDDGTIRRPVDFWHGVKERNHDAHKQRTELGQESHAVEAVQGIRAERVLDQGCKHEAEGHEGSDGQLSWRPGFDKH